MPQGRLIIKGRFEVHPDSRKKRDRRANEEFRERSRAFRLTITGGENIKATSRRRLT